MEYKPQTITKALIRKAANANPPETPMEIRDKTSRLILRHQPSGYLSLYVELGRKKRERLCNARRIINEADGLTIGMVRKEAEKIRGQSASGRDFKTERQQQAAVPTLAAYLDDTYTSWAKTNLRSGEANAHRIKARFPAFLKLKLGQITPAKLEKWKEQRVNEVTRETINRDIATLRAALGRAVKLDVLAENPLKTAELMEVDRKARKVRALTQAEKERLITALHERDDRKRADRASGNKWRAERGAEPLPTIGKYADVLTPAVTVSLETGLRYGELFALEWKSIDFKARTLNVEGETAKTFETREVPLNNTALQTLRDWWLQCGQPKGGLVFTINGKPIGSLKKSYHAILEQAGIPRIDRKGKRINWHSLRHTFGSLLGAANVDPVTLKELMGHANLETTQRYLHSDEARQRAAVDALEAV